MTIFSKSWHKLKILKNEEFEMNVTFWHVMTYCDGANRFKGLCYFKMKIGQLKSERQGVCPSPTQIIGWNKRHNKNRNCQCHCSPFAESLEEFSKTLGDNKSRTKDATYSIFLTFFSFFSLMDNKASIKIKILFKYKFTSLSDFYKQRNYLD